MSTVAPVFTQGQRVIAAAARHTGIEPWLSGGPGEVRRIVPIGINEHFIYVCLDGTTEAVPYYATQLRLEPAV